MIRNPTSQNAQNQMIVRDLMRKANETSDGSRLQFSLSTTLQVMVGLSLVLGLGAAFGLDAFTQLVVVTFLLIRLILILNARPVWISLPLLVATIILPVILLWAEIQGAWFNPKRLDPISSWAWRLIAYLSIPLWAWILDFTQNYQSKRERYVRVGFEVMVLFVWLFVSIAVVGGMNNVN